MVFVKVIAFILGMMMFGFGISFDFVEQGVGMMRSLALGGLAVSIVVAWAEIKSTIIASLRK
ncbi:hypothetical protein ACLMPM_22730 [Yersinia enterocolitica]|uniref:hypothetical protein n=1 Tax=Yersinia enterocolitica TaxID=630 RepID=UPI00398D1AF3